MSEIRNQADAQIEKLHSQLNLALQAKTSFEDLETVVHKLHAKADYDKV